MPPATGTAGTRIVPARLAGPPAWPRRPGVIITVAALLGLGLRVFQLTRPGYLTGFTQYDDGVYIGNALRLVNGVIPYRDFAMVQPPGSMLLMVPAALGGKVFGSAWALAAARVLTIGADTANVVLAGLLVRHRGALAAGVASGLYAVYPAALNASQSLFLEPWLNLFCLLGAVILFDGDHLAGHRGVAGENGSRRAFWAGVCFGFGTAVKIWAALPALVAWLLCLRARRDRVPFAGGFLVGIAVPCLPFLALAPSGFGRTVFVSELVQATHGRVGANPRLADITGIVGLSSVGVNPKIWAGATAAGILLLFVVIAWLRARRAGSRATALDWFALICTLVVTGMLFSPSEWYVHYAAFAGPFLAVLVGLSAGRLVAARHPPVKKPRPWVRVCAGVVAALLIAAMGAADGYIVVTTLYPARDLSAASALIPPGACVLTDTAAATVVIDRFSASSPGCPAIVDTVGTLIATTHGKDFVAGPGVLQADTQVWQQAFQQARYVWLIGNNGYTGARIAWTPALHAYFETHFRLIGLPSSYLGAGNVPRGGLYIRKS
ncbi:MAG TPA: glycosyltransferase family 87 protein [Streptosporangiaceae bacterium]|nr:glycosyltransferase family 87 protein [Streptosporangiaceae bacterium]